MQTTVQQPGKIPLPGLFSGPLGTGATLPRGHYLGGGMSELLDLLRAIAAALVVMLHARLHTLGDMSQVNAATDTLGAVLVASVSIWGKEAVIVFFVLSGYLIGGQVLNAPRTDRRFWTSYGVNRLSRISIVMAPAVLFSVAVAYGSQALWGVSYTAISQGCRPGAWDAIGNLLFLQNVVVRRLCSNGPIWSIANEVFYYALFPLLFIALRGSGLRARMLAAAGVALLVAYGLQEPENEVAGMLPYFGAWMLGAAAAYPFGRGRHGLLLLVPVLGFAVVCMLSGLEPGIRYYYAIALVTTGALLLVRRWGVPGWLRRAGVKRAAQSLAAFSYSLYLFHMPAMNLARAAFGMPRASGEVSLATVSLFAAFVVLAYAAGGGAWWLFERHTLRLRTAVSRLIAPGLLARPTEVAPAKP